VGFEPTTPGLKVRSSTAELRARSFPNRIWSAPVLTTGRFAFGTAAWDRRTILTQSAFRGDNSY
jgi:hypothetical protein